MKKQNPFYIYVIVVISIFLQTQNSVAQGCVAIKGNATSCMMIHPDSTNVAGWQLATSGRYFRSYRHFYGTEENKQRLNKKQKL